MKGMNLPQLLRSKVKESNWSAMANGERDENHKAGDESCPNLPGRTGRIIGATTPLLELTCCCDYGD
jgi:hypothetical protein